MPRITFIKDFTWKAKRGVRIVYKAGQEYPITSRCLREAQAAGAVAPETETATAPQPARETRRSRHERG